MPTTKFDPFALVGTTLFKDLNRLFDLTPTVPGTDLEAMTPRANVAETTDAFLVSVELPGIDPDAIDVSFEDEMLTISGERTFATEEQTEEGATYRRREIYEGHFTRKIRLHADVVVDEISATAANGILQVTVPKTPAPEPRKVTVTVQR